MEPAQKNAIRRKQSFRWTPAWDTTGKLWRVALKRLVLEKAEYSIAVVGTTQKFFGPSLESSAVDSPLPCSPRYICSDEYDEREIQIRHNFDTNLTYYSLPTSHQPPPSSEASIEFKNDESKEKRSIN